MNQFHLSAHSASMDGVNTVPVLIVGGGPVGLCGPLPLARLGIRSLLVERHPGTAIQPKARGIDVRTMELLRTWGLEEQVRAAGQQLAGNSLRLCVESLTGKETRRVEDLQQERNASSFMSSISPTSSCLCMQEDFEPIILAAARQFPSVDIRFSTELIAIEQEETGIRATLRDSTSGEQRVILAQYVVAADGAHSSVRRLLHIPMHGPGELARILNIDFHADLTQIMAERKLIWCIIHNDMVSGILLPVNNTNRWLFNIRLEPGAQPQAETMDHYVNLVRQAVGIEQLDVSILSTQIFTLAAGIAKQYQQGRTFLVGDAAHLMPPSGAFGMNTGIQDIHNLTWKLAAVLSGWAHHSLLESYEAERKPVAQATLTQAFNRMDDMEIAGFTQPTPSANTPSVDRAASTEESQSSKNLAIILSYGYTSSTIGGVQTRHATSLSTEALERAHVGYRAPHLWLRQKGQRQSALDIFHDSYVLLAGPDGSKWLEAGRQIAAEGPVPLTCYGIAPLGNLIDEERKWDAIYGGLENVAVLVRPDGFIAWMCPRISEIRSC